MNDLSPNLVRLIRQHDGWCCMSCEDDLDYYGFPIYDFMCCCNSLVKEDDYDAVANFIAIRRFNAAAEKPAPAPPRGPWDMVI